MSSSRRPPSPQEALWAGEFGTAYIGRNSGDELLASNLAFFSRALRRAGRVSSCLEFGANVGLNLEALRLLYPHLARSAVEINATAAAALAALIGEENVRTESIFDYEGTATADLVLTKGVLIHVAPDMLNDAYQKLYEASKRLILVAEYYNPSPVAVPYRGYSGQLFKRDFAGDLLDLYPALSLLDYGFAYRRDPAFPQDDITWFLLERAG